MITGRAVSVLLLHHHRRAAVRRAGNCDYAGALRPEEREYLQRLARTYALLFTLNTEPRLLEYFQDMGGDFRLYVGSDQIVRALSERYVPEADRMTQNTILMAARTGAKLILTEPVLDEVVNHLGVAPVEGLMRRSGSSCRRSESRGLGVVRC